MLAVCPVRLTPYEYTGSNPEQVALTAAHPHTQPRIVRAAHCTHNMRVREPCREPRRTPRETRCTPPTQRSENNEVFRGGPQYRSIRSKWKQFTKMRARPAQYSLDSTNWVRAVKHHPHFLHPGAGHWGVGSWAGMRVEASHKVTVKSKITTKITHTHTSHAPRAPGPLYAASTRALTAVAAPQRPRPKRAPRTPAAGGRGGRGQRNRRPPARSIHNLSTQVEDGTV